ncbi:MAG: hypothetical protein M0R70_11280 [Nitrospirae bacterium]|nr:hypothetical protein [Nitrospirota bacterium]
MKNRLWIVGIIIVFVIAVVLVSGRSEGGANNSGPVVSTIAGQKATSGSNDGAGTDAHFGFSAGITTDGTNLYVTDTFNHTIRKVVISTAAVTTLAGTAGISGSMDGIGSAARFNSPQGITTDGTNLFVADTVNQTIRKINIITGQVSTLAGTAGVIGAADGIGPNAQFNHPSGITNDGSNLFVADMKNNIVRKILINTGQVMTLAGTAGKSGSSDGTGSSALFNYPAGITIDGPNLYIVDNSNSTIRKIVLETGSVTTLAGIAGTLGSTDGTGGAALFNYPLGIASDGNCLFVTDTGNSNIRKIVISGGQVTTLAGTTGKVGSDDGNATNARFSIPSGIVAGTGTTLYIADMGAIRKIK